MIESPQNLTVGGVTAAFHVGTPLEYWRVTHCADEREVVDCFLSDIELGDIVWDVGAAIGRFSCLAAVAGASVVAFEPHPGNAERLRENAALNEVDIDVRQLALGSSAGTTWLSDEGTTAIGTHRIDPSGNLEVDVERGDEIYPHPDVVKIDVEGAELDVLAGMETVLETARVVYVECHPEHGIGADQVLELLQSAGFETSNVESARSEPFVRGIRNHHS